MRAAVIALLATTSFLARALSSAASTAHISSTAIIAAAHICISATHAVKACHLTLWSAPRSVRTSVIDPAYVSKPDRLGHLFQLSGCTVAAHLPATRVLVPCSCIGHEWLPARAGNTICPCIGHVWLPACACISSPPRAHTPPISRVHQSTIITLSANVHMATYT